MLLLFLLTFHTMVWLHLRIFDSFPGGSCGKESVGQCRRHKRHGFDPREDPLEEEMATQSSILAWKIPWTEDPEGLQRVRLLGNWAES